MGLTNGITPEHLGGELQELQQALVSSSTKWRLLELAELKGNIEDGCM